MVSSRFFTSMLVRCQHELNLSYAAAVAAVYLLAVHLCGDDQSRRSWIAFVGRIAAHHDIEALAHDGFDELVERGLVAVPGGVALVVPTGGLLDVMETLIAQSPQGRGGG